MDSDELKNHLHWVADNAAAADARDQLGQLLGDRSWWEDDGALNTLANALSTGSGAGLAAELQRLDDYDQVQAEWLEKVVGLLQNPEQEGAEEEGAERSPAEWDAGWQMFRRFNSTTQAWEYATTEHAAPGQWLTYEQALAERSR